MRLYIKSNRPLEEIANSIVAVALPDHECQLRDGLNIGGGEYFKFFTANSEITLVCNDADHLDVFAEEKASFPFYCYPRKGGNATLEAMHSFLKITGLECELDDENI